MYYLDDQYIVQEYCYTEGHGWYQGQTGEMKTKANPLSRLSAITYQDQEGTHLRVYYQGECDLPPSNCPPVETTKEAKTNIVKELAYDGKWYMGEMQIKDAVEGTGLAAVTYGSGRYRQICVFYQNLSLSLIEYYHNEKGWFTSEFISPVGAPSSL